MLSNLAANEAVRQFSFDSGTFLYRDFYGRRVVADVEGAGSFFIDRADPRLLVLRDEDPESVFRKDFSSSLTVIASGDAEGSVWVHTGPAATIPDRAWEDVSEFVPGCGHYISVDPRAPWPIPYFFGCGPEIAAKVARAAADLRQVALLSVADPASLKAAHWRVQNMSDLFPLESVFEDGTPHSGRVASHLNAASFRTDIPERCCGLLLEKTFDRFHGRQRARVLVDGDFAAWWYEPTENRVQRWGKSLVGLPEEVVGGRSSVEITIDPPAGTPLWSVSEMRVWALVKPPQSTG